MHNGSYGQNFLLPVVRKPHEPLFTDRDAHEGKVTGGSWGSLPVILVCLCSYWTVPYAIVTMATLAAKHFLNTPASLVLDSLQGLCALNHQVRLDSQNKSEHSDHRTSGRPLNKIFAKLCMSLATTRTELPLFVVAAQDTNLPMQVS